VTELDARRFQVLIHAVGDRGVHVALDAIAQARQVNGPREARHQLVHIELAAAQDMARFAELGVVACMQPRHCAADVGGAEWRAAAGPARWPLAWPFRSLHQAVAILAFSSDWNVAEMDPLTGNPPPAMVTVPGQCRTGSALACLGIGLLATVGE